MTRLYIIGIVSSGKTTLARSLSATLGVPHYELDAIVWSGEKKNQQKRPPEAQVQRIREIDSAGGWIIEGTYRPSCHCLLDMADHVLFLDPPLWKRKARILTRFIRQRLGMEYCQYAPDLAMLRSMYRWTRNFERDRPAFDALLAPYAHKLHHVTDTRAATSLPFCKEAP